MTEGERPDVETLLRDATALRKRTDELEAVAADLLVRTEAAESQVATLEREKAVLEGALRNLIEDVDEAMAEDLTLHALQQKIGALYLGYGGGWNHDDDLRAALSDSGQGQGE
jgi:predicted RNase H-like nuclease (RuvC/YqgF family)